MFHSKRFHYLSKQSKFSHPIDSIKILSCTFDPIGLTCENRASIRKFINFKHVSWNSFLFKSCYDFAVFVFSYIIFTELSGVDIQWHSIRKQRLWVRFPLVSCSPLLVLALYYIIVNYIVVISNNMIEFCNFFKTEREISYMSGNWRTECLEMSWAIHLLVIFKKKLSWLLCKLILICLIWNPNEK